MSGLLSKAITNGAVQMVAEVPASAARSLVDILVVNPTESEASLVVWISSQANPTTVDLVDPLAKIPAGGRASYPYCNCSAGEKIFVQAPAGLVVRVTNIDEA